MINKPSHKSLYISIKILIIQKKRQSEYDTTKIQRTDIQWPKVGQSTSNSRGRPK